MLSILVELGFLSNENESEYYQKPDSYQALALVLLECIIKILDSYERVGNLDCYVSSKGNN